MKHWLILKPKNLGKNKLSDTIDKLRVKLKLPKSMAPKGRPKGSHTNCIGLPLKRKAPSSKSTGSKKGKSDPKMRQNTVSQLFQEKLVSQLAVSLEEIGQKVQYENLPVVKKFSTAIRECCNPPLTLCLDVDRAFSEEAREAAVLVSRSYSLPALREDATMDQVSYVQLLSALYTGAYFMKCDILQFCETLKQKPGHMKHVFDTKKILQNR